MNIDWAKAPQWADRVLAMGMTGAWAWANEHQYQYIGKINKEIFLYEEENTWKLSDGELIEMKLKPEIWKGTGLPPVGTVCEVLWNESRMEYLRTKVFGVNEHGQPIHRFDEGPKKFEYQADPLVTLTGIPVFRPIRTQEQIEAEEREKAIDQICYDICFHFGNPKGSEKYLNLATTLYDAGYRKQPKEDA